MITLPESYNDLLKAPGVAILTTINADGTPQTSALWFLFDETDGKLKISLNRSRQKTKNLERNPALTLFFIDPANPYRTLEVRGRALIDPDADGAVVAKVNAKYGAHVQDNDRPGEKRVAVTIDVTKVNTFPHA
jgi:PPOX class probable F420-dependent enzyme